MNLPITVDQAQLKEILLNVGLVRPIFIWGAPGIGKSSIVEEFAAELGLPCVCLTGSQLAPEDLIGVPQIIDGTSVFCPPRSLVRKEPFCLFLDELNACSLEVQKAFYSLILERRIGEYHLPEGSIVLAAGNRMQDGAITHPLPSALLNRMFHVELQPSARTKAAWRGSSAAAPLATAALSVPEAPYTAVRADSGQENTERLCLLVHPANAARRTESC